MYNIQIYIHIHVFRPAQDSSVWLGLTSREQLMSPECSKYQVLSLAKMLVVNEQKTFCSHQCSPEYLINKFRGLLQLQTQNTNEMLMSEIMKLNMKYYLKLKIGN